MSSETWRPVPGGPGLSCRNADPARPMRVARSLRFSVKFAKLFKVGFDIYEEKHMQVRFSQGAISCDLSSKAGQGAHFGGSHVLGVGGKREA